MGDQDLGSLAPSWRQKRQVQRKKSPTDIGVSFVNAEIASVVDSAYSSKSIFVPHRDAAAQIFSSCNKDSFRPTSRPY